MYIFKTHRLLKLKTPQPLESKAEFSFPNPENVNIIRCTNVFWNIMCGNNYVR